MDKYTQFLKSAVALLLVLVVWLYPITLVPVAILVIVALFLWNKEYQKGAYYQVTKNSYFAMRSDLGKYGEYLIYKQLKHLEETGGKFLFNLYIPKENEETTEIDVLLICSKGLFVFESKNYSGWIFGNEFEKTWTQTLPQGRSSHKEHFYNPIWQNQAHMKHLKNLLGDQIPMRSVIVFSERCTLKNVNIQAIDIHVINRYDIKDLFSALCGEDIPDSLSEAEIGDIYNKLYPYTQVGDAIKEQHIANIEKNHGLSEIPAVEERIEEVAEETVVEPVVVEAPVVGKEPVASTAEKTKLPVADADILVENAGIETENTQPLKCPRCGGNLILRTAKRGQNAGKQFYGCEGYPGCRYVEEVETEKGR